MPEWVKAAYGKGLIWFDAIKIVRGNVTYYNAFMDRVIQAIEKLAELLPNEDRRAEFAAKVLAEFEGAADIVVAGKSAQDGRPDWIEAHKQGVEVPEFVKKAFVAELADGTMHRGMFDRYKNLRRDFHAYQRHHKLPEWLASIPTKSEWDKQHPPAPLPAEEVKRLEREARRAQRHQRRAHSARP